MLNNISYSALNSWLLCGESFRRTYFEERLPPNINMWRGTSVHNTLEVNHSQKIDSEVDLKLDYLHDYCRDEYVHGVKDNGVYMPNEDKPFKNKLLNQGLNQSLNAITAYKEKLAPDIHPLKVEEYIRTDIGLDMPISGRIDLQTKDKVITDFKIGKRKARDWEHKDLQPSFYSLLKYVTEKELPIFKYNIIPNNGNIQELQTSRSFNDLKILILYIKLFIKDLKAGIFRPCQAGGWKCSERYCHFFTTCKYMGN